MRRITTAVLISWLVLLSPVCASADSILLGAKSPLDVGAAIYDQQANAQPFSLNVAARISAVDVLVQPFLGGARSSCN